jgi:hypothetical protein
VRVSSGTLNAKVLLQCGNMRGAERFSFATPLTDMERFMATNDVLEGVDFDYECSKLLKDELHRRGLTYRQLAVLLNEAGMDAHSA